VRSRKTKLLAVIGALGPVMLTSGVPAMSASVESRLTALVGRACRFEPPRNDVASAEEQVKHCPGVGGARVRLFADHAQIALSFVWGRNQSTPDIVRAWSVGERLEWRGTKVGQSFVPHAATVRVLFNKEGTAVVERQILAVMRVRPNEACLVGVVDATAHKDAYQKARILADDVAPAFACGRDKPQIAGARTRWAVQLLPGSE
jgi:hypothetical protein